MTDQKQYIAIDLKSFYASVECLQRGLDPLTANLVVADPSKTEKTICLAVTPSLKAYGISGRARLFEVVEKVRAANYVRRKVCGKISGKSADDTALKADPTLEIDYIVAPPQMAKYMQISNEIYKVYLEFVSPEDIHPYSIDEVFIDVTGYLKKYNCTAHELALRMVRAVLQKTGITATAGVGTNLYLAKIAMDILAKKMPADKDGVRIAELNERTYRETLWSHRPLTAFWRVGKGIATKLEAHGLYTMGDIARCSMQNEELLYTLFGVNAELLIDHAWGYEPCEIRDIKAYTPAVNSISTGQVLSCPYSADKARLIVHEMIDWLSLDLVEKRLVTDQIVLDIGYDIDNLQHGTTYSGEVVQDRYGRRIPKHAHGTATAKHPTSSTHILTELTLDLFDRIINPKLTVRRVNLTAGRVVAESDVATEADAEQLDFFTDYTAAEKQREQETAARKRERAKQETIIGLRRRFGKNAVLKGMNFKEGATARERNDQIGGHKA